jgi:signal transduction histidine kinase
VLRAPFSAPAWLATVHVVLGGLIGWLTGGVVIMLAALTVGLAVTVVFGVLSFAALLASGRLFTSWQRSRFAALLGVHIAPVPHRHDAPLLRRVAAEARAASTWRRLGYHLLAGVLGPLGMFVVVGAWSTGLLLASAPLYDQAWLNLTPAGWSGMLARVGLAAAGLVVLLAAPWVARAVAAADAAAAHRMLELSRSEELARRVESLAASRADVVNAADAERRRIERDLHDGTQQRLTSLALNLGIARATLTDLPPSAEEAIAQAHEEAKQALAELRNFVRGMHPAILDDLGLDAALSGIAARSPVPVRLRVAMSGRATPAVEAVAYFVVSEALTNTAKHAGAAKVEVAVEQIGDQLRIMVRDDGCGGADPDRGTGLHGLTQRVRSVDGTLRVDSPVGGPTTILAELPCAS